MMASTDSPRAILLASDGLSPNAAPSGLPALHYRLALVHLLQQSPVVGTHPELSMTTAHAAPPQPQRRPAPKSKSPAERIEAHLRKRGWESTWRYKMFKQPHYHSTTHELLAVSSGTATVQLGGGGAPHPVANDDTAADAAAATASTTQHTLDLEPGDLLLLPAGYTHHALVQSPDFQLIGSYPEGSMPWDMRLVPATPHAAAPSPAASPHGPRHEGAQLDCSRYSDEIKRNLLERPRKGLFDASDPAGAGDGLEHHWAVAHV